MSTFVQNDYYLVEMNQALIAQLLDLIAPEHLDYTPGGENPPLRELFREIAWTQEVYIASFRDFEFRHTPGESSIDATSIDSLRIGFERLHADLKDAVAKISDEDFAGKTIDRGDGFDVPPAIQIHIYREAILIFCAKSSVYLRCLGIALTEQWVDWIG